MSSSLTIFLSDRQSSVLASRVDREQRSIQYTPYGYTEPSVSPRTVGYTGQLREKNFGWYMLGNGHRIYNPKLKRFHSPDHLSPFERGGINSYAYVQNDPMNFTDPDGLAANPMMWLAGSSISLANSGVSFVHNGMKMAKSYLDNKPYAVVEIAGQGLKSAGGVIAGTASFIKFSNQTGDMDPKYSGVDNSPNDFGLAVAYMGGATMALVGEGMLLGISAVEMFRKHYGNGRDKNNTRQGEVNQQLILHPPAPLEQGRSSMSRGNHGTGQSSQEMAIVRDGRD
ncbi:RHS repeat-associated core domain-containing protein [Pseudomonas sp. GD04091]|nr:MULTISPECIES: RHS repeat-associated core domain-containing protein [unclassified Pseudomonas]MDH0304249.1 RHS repeat-associated core domain-containing protein [Pseudomonas sp. GD04091]MDH1986989.1 RHS repeat-associated core domain-containing protein [Pseudomonas sp. GD03689]